MIEACCYQQDRNRRDKRDRIYVSLGNTQLLQKTGHEPQSALSVSPVASVEKGVDRLFSHHYDELISVARRLRRRSAHSPTLMTGDLVHESFVRMRASGPWVDDRHFLLSAARAMRHVMIDRARTRLAAKRNSSGRIEFDDAAMPDQQDAMQPEDVLEIAGLLSQLQIEEPRLVRVIDCRFFAGYSQVETADILGVDERTVRRDWNRARAWLMVRVSSSAA
jgi:RNA polymerase sigma factor (TIGR02999 family)